MIVRFFALYKERTGLSATNMEVTPGTTAQDLLDILRRLHKSLPGAAPVMIAINGEYANPNTLLCENDEIAFIPPVSGGV